MQNLAAQIIPTKIRSVVEAQVLAEYVKKSVERVAVENQNAIAMHSRITESDLSAPKAPKAPKPTLMQLMDELEAKWTAYKEDYYLSVMGRF